MFCHTFYFYTYCSKLIFIYSFIFSKDIYYFIWFGICGNIPICGFYFTPAFANPASSRVSPGKYPSVVATMTPVRSITNWAGIAGTP